MNFSNSSLERYDNPGFQEYCLNPRKNRDNQKYRNKLTSEIGQFLYNILTITQKTTVNLFVPLQKIFTYIKYFSKWQVVPVDISEAFDQEWQGDQLQMYVLYFISEPTNHFKLV